MRYFVKHVFIDNTRKLSDTISKSKLPEFSPLNPSAQTAPSMKSPKMIAKEVAQAQKVIDIARGRRIPIGDILQYDILSENPLFDGDLPKKPDKSVLVKEIENRTAPSGIQFTRN